LTDYLSQIKDTTIADFETYAGCLEKLNQEMNYVVVADPATIEANKELFDRVTYLQ
jgi:16S rRNA G527 N7-methylase RsmG